MGKLVDDSVLDAALNVIGAATSICVCSTQPTTYAEAITTYKLAISATPTFQSPEDGDTNGRKITVDEEATIPVDATGDAEHVALVNSVGSVLLYVTTCTLQGLTSGNTVTIPPWDIEIADPTP